MFGLGMAEIIVIAVVALLFVGPDKLPQAAKSIGSTIRGLRRQTRDLTHSLEADSELGDAVRELRSAFRDEPYRPPPKPVAMPSSSALPADEQEDLSAGDEDPDDVQLEAAADIIERVVGPHAAAMARSSSAGADVSDGGSESTNGAEPDSPSSRGEG